jgi:TrmH family RNA methyltransferase
LPPATGLFLRLTAAAEFDCLCVVLVATRNPVNIGAVARAMSNFGFHRLRVVCPYEPAFREARSAVGASSILAQAEEYGSVADAVADCALVVGTTAARNRELQHPLRSLEEGAAVLRHHLAAGNHVALLFGSEKRGLSNEDFSYCHWLMRIPTRQEHPSMNLGQAAAVCLYQIAGQARAAAQPPSSVPATAAALERVTDALIQALRLSGYTKPRSTSEQARMRRWVRRLDLSSDDAELWLGMLRQMIWKMRSSK